MYQVLDAIVCVDENWAIGANNKLLYHLTGDMQHFREMTYNKTVIMGRNTMMSLPHPDKGLLKRRNIVLTHHDEGINTDAYLIAHNTKELWELLSETPGYLNPIVIGGSSIYELLLPYCKYIHVTKVFQKHPNPDRFFPNLDENENWKSAYQSDMKIEIISNNNCIQYQICTYKRQPKSPSKYSEIRTNYMEEETQTIYVDAWMTSDDNEEGSVIAKIKCQTKKVEYLDPDAITDIYAQEQIQAVLNTLTI